MEQKRARNWYTWLWVAPFVTIPIMSWLYTTGIAEWVGGFLCTGIAICDPFFTETIPSVLLALTPILYYSIILLMATRQEDDFVRWHGFQAFALGAIYTAIPAASVLLSENHDTGMYIGLPLLLIAWFIGTRWGQNQVKRGKCSLASWLGYLEISSPALRGAPPTVQATIPQTPSVAPPTDPELSQARQSIQQVLTEAFRPKPAPTVTPTPKTKKPTKKSVWGIISFLIYAGIFIASRLLGDSSDTGTVDQSTTQTSQAQVDVLATRAAVNTAQAYQAELSTYAAWHLVYSDDFSENQYGWYTGEYDDEYARGSRELSAGTYVWDLTANTPSIQRSLFNNNPILSDFYVSVDIQALNDQTNIEHGLYFRWQEGDYYIFIFNEAGWFEVHLLNAETWTTLIEPTYSEAILGGESNRVAVAAQGDRFAFFINDRFVAETTNGELEQGSVGLIIMFEQEGEQARIAFDNIELRAPESE